MSIEVPGEQAKMPGNASDDQVETLIEAEAAMYLQWRLGRDLFIARAVKEKAVSRS